MYLLDLYISKLPPGAVEKDIFYCWLLENYEEKDYWYSAQPWGKHQLNEMVKHICKKAEINATIVITAYGHQGPVFYSSLKFWRRLYKTLLVTGL